MIKLQELAFQTNLNRIDVTPKLEYEYLNARKFRIGMSSPKLVALGTSVDFFNCSYAACNNIHNVQVSLNVRNGKAPEVAHVTLAYESPTAKTSLSDSVLAAFSCLQLCVYFLAACISVFSCGNRTFVCNRSRGIRICSTRTLDVETGIGL